MSTHLWFLCGCYTSQYDCEAAIQHSAAQHECAAAIHHSAGHISDFKSSDKCPLTIVRLWGWLENTHHLETHPLRLSSSYLYPRRWCGSNEYNEGIPPPRVCATNEIARRSEMFPRKCEPTAATRHRALNFTLARADGSLVTVPEWAELHNRAPMRIVSPTTQRHSVWRNFSQTSKTNLVSNASVVNGRQRSKIGRFSSAKFWAQRQ